MLPNILRSIGIAETLEAMIGDSKSEQLLKLFASYHPGMWLYPGVIKRKIGLSIKETYEVLRELEKRAIVHGYCELYCSRCQRSSGEVFEVISQMPETFYCELCHDELPAFENAFLIYKVV